MQQLVVCHGPGRFKTTVDPAEISEIRQDSSITLWLDLINPTPTEIQLLQQEFDFHPLAIEDALRGAQRPKVDSYGNYYFVVFYCLDMDPQTFKLRTTPLYLFIGKNYLVTIHAAPINEIEHTVQRWQAPNSPLEHDVGSLIYALLDALVDEYFPMMDQIAERVADMETAIFERYDEDVLQTIFQLKKDLLYLRRIVSPERDVLNVMLRRDIPVFTSAHVTYLQDVYDHIIRTTDAIDTYRELLSSALDSFLSVQSNRLNQIVKVLTVASIVLMSITVVAGIFGMNFEYMPELRWRYGYFYALGLMATLAVGLIAFFRRIKWL